MTPITVLTVIFRRISPSALRGIRKLESGHRIICRAIPFLFREYGRRGFLFGRKQLRLLLINRWVT